MSKNSSLEQLMPHKNEWALEYVITETAIPKIWREFFYDELVSENEVYRNELENALRVHGVRWS